MKILAVVIVVVVVAVVIAVVAVVAESTGRCTAMVKSDALLPRHSRKTNEVKYIWKMHLQRISRCLFHFKQKLIIINNVTGNLCKKIRDIWFVVV